MARTRTLYDPATGRSWATHLDGAKTEVRQGAPGRERVAARTHEGPATARRWAMKEEWTRLKKGMVLLDPDAPWGEPRLHCFVGGAYTGAMAIASDGEGGFLCNRFAAADEMVHVAPDGGVAVRLVLPGERLVWKAARAAATGAVLLQVDGGVVRWAPHSGNKREVVPYRPNPGFVSVAGTRLASYDGMAAIVLDLVSGEELLRVPVAAGMHGCHSPQMEGALSADGHLLALCVRPGEILILDVDTGRPHAALRGDFAMVRRMDFLPDGRRLLVAESYGRWSLRCLDIGIGRPDPGWTEVRIDTGAVAVSPAGDRVAVAGRDAISIYGLETDGLPGSFALEHAVRRCAMDWIADDALAVRTDCGCASIYAVP